MEEPQPVAPRVTALIVSHNRAAALRRCLAALEASSDRPALEIMVVDNGSTDESPRLDTEFPNTTFLRLPRNFGKTKALNIGIRTAAADLLLFLSPEVEVPPGAVSTLASVLDADPGAVAVCPWLADPEGRPAPNLHAFPTAAALYRDWSADAHPEPFAIAPADAAVPVPCATLDALLARKYFVKGLNYFDARYGEFGPDAELCFQVRRAGKKIMMLGTVQAVMHPPSDAPASDAVRALLSADRLSAAAAFASKHSGLVSGHLVRLRGILFCLFSALSFREPGYRWRRLWAVLGFQKIDGSQNIPV